MSRQKAPKPTKVEYEKRIDECVEMIMSEGWGWSRFTNYYVETYGTNRKVANEAWKHAWAKIDEITEKKMLISIEALVTKLEEIVENGTNSERLKAIEQLRKIGGVDAAEKHDIKHTGNITFDFGGGRIPVNPANPDLL